MENTIQIGQVTLTLKMDLIQDQQTDVIVNTASENLDLRRGAVSKALLEKAGHEMQTEILNAIKSNCFISTKAYKLNCKEVYHTFCVEKSRRDSQKIFYESITECLWTADAKGHKSISFPFIGTGNLGFSDNEAATIMLVAVTQFALYTLDSMAVYFVIHPSDHQIFQAFKDEMKNIQKQFPRPNQEHGSVELVYSSKLESKVKDSEISEPSAAEPPVTPSRRKMEGGLGEESSDPVVTQLPEAHQSRPPTYSSDEHFLLSLLPLLQNMPPHKKEIIKFKMYKLALENSNFMLNSEPLEDDN